MDVFHNIISALGRDGIINLLMVGAIIWITCRTGKDFNEDAWAPTLKDEFGNLGPAPQINPDQPGPDDPNPGNRWA